MYIEGAVSLRIQAVPRSKHISTRS